MKTNVAQTSIDCFYNHVQQFTESQNERVMAVVKAGQDYSLCELMELTSGIDKSSMARVVNKLRTQKRLMPATKRFCTISGKCVIPSKIFEVQVQLDLLQ